MQDKGWHGITPLHSRRHDVEKLIGPPLEPNGITYDLAQERVNIVYSESSCVKGWPYGWNVEPGTVLSIVIYPKTSKSITELKIDLSKYQKQLRPERQLVLYHSDEEGITVEVDSTNQLIKSIQYLPKSSDNNLRCPESATRESSRASGESALIEPILSYHDLSKHHQRLKLDQFENTLRERSKEFLVYIIGYGDERLCAGEAKRQMDWVKNYLVKKNVASSRIKTIDGGYSDQKNIELFIVPPGGSIPLSSPNIYPRPERINRDCDQR
jgi:hypothetical protein